MKLTKYILISLLIALNFSQCSKNDNPDSSVKKPVVKNVIFMIGDGMGLAQAYAGMTANKGPLNLERIQTVGLAKTYSASDYITDSAASGTAIACGEKTTNGTIGLDAAGNMLKSMLTYAADNAKSTGIVVTSSVTHATPASFYAHQPSRNMEEEIAEDLLNANVDVFIGGGRKFFESRTDGQNFTEQLKSKGYQIAYTIDEVKAAQPGKLGALLADNSMPTAKDRGDMLSTSVETAIRLLEKNKKGFFLMVEGSQIDFGGHSNDADMVVKEVLDFDQAIKVALDYAESNPETLVVITADHETGGLSLIGGNLVTGDVQLDFATGNHTGIMVPVYAFGLGAEYFSGIYENTEFFPRILELLAIQKK